MAARKTGSAKPLLLFELLLRQQPVFDVVVILAASGIIELKCPWMIQT